MELSGPAGMIQKASDYREAQELTEKLRGTYEEKPPALGFLILASAGAVVTTIGLYFGDIPFFTLLWRVPLGALIIWPVSTLIVFVLELGEVKLKHALLAGAIPSAVILLTFLAPFLIAVLILMFLVLQLISELALRKPKSKTK